MSLRMSWMHYQINQKDGILNSPPYSYGVNGNFPKESSPFPSSSGTRISPAVLFIIVILAVLFFISGLLHLLVRFLTKNQSSSQSDGNLEASTSDALQRQLQQLFHLHDSGLEQAFIDALPLFSYKEILGPKEPCDCAVCLCEFSEMDQLRLLPLCSHAFHMNCIDTWLLSNSTCPLCRGTLFNPGFSIENPVFDYDDDEGCQDHGENGLSNAQKGVEIEEVGIEMGIFPVRLGKFRKMNGVEGEVGDETGTSKLDARRCYSMGSYQYVVGEVNLQVTLNKDRTNREGGLFKGTEGVFCNRADENGDGNGKKISIGTKNDSYSISKIWLWSNKGKFASSSKDNLASPNMELPWMNRGEGI